MKKTIAMLWRHDLWEQMEHIPANFGNIQGDLLLEKGNPILISPKL